MVQAIQAVDLFSGCGGLSLGFELYKGKLNYRVVMALDNAIAPVACYNRNFPIPNGTVQTARLCDLTWFEHSSEVLLYYLVHFALWRPDHELIDALNSPKINLPAFLSGLNFIDREYEERLQNLVSQPNYAKFLGEVDQGVFGTAIYRSFLEKIGFSSLKRNRLSPLVAPWQEEYSNLWPSEPVRQACPTIDKIEENLAKLWIKELNNLEEAANKNGNGRYRTASRRLRTLLEFLQGEAGGLLREVWIKWRLQRDSLRASFCTRIEPSLQDLYSGTRRVQLVLGGPPCKGFSRIARPVIESLRNQGVYAWVSKDYGDERNALLHKYVLFLEALRPDVFIFENVPQFQSVLKTPSGRLDAASILAQSIQDLSGHELSFNVKLQTINARHHAVPQDRKRFFMVGFNSLAPNHIASESFFDLSTYAEDVPLSIALQGLDAPVEFDYRDPNSNTTNYCSKAYTLLDPQLPESHIRYISWIRQGNSWADSDPPENTDGHVVRKLRPDDLALIQKFAPGQRWMDYKLRKSPTLAALKNTLQVLESFLQVHADVDLPPLEEVSSLLEKIDGGLLLRLVLEEVTGQGEMEQEHHLLQHNYLAKGNGKHGDWFERLSADRPSKTIVAHIGKDTYAYIHPFLNRAISIREAARIQSFPDFFSFRDTGIVDGYTMIGNAVPPLLANVLAKRLAEVHAQTPIFRTHDRQWT